jgi:hypothetical protein
MSGQGRPRDRLFRALEKSCARWSFVLTALAILLPRYPAAAAEPIDVRIRVAWGGGEARSWQGTMQLSEGTLSEVQPLGLEADEPGSMLLIDDKTLRVFARTPRSYDGLDLRVQAPPEA